MPIRSAFLAFAFAAISGQTLLADDWPQWLGPKRDGIWREEGLVNKFPAGGPKVKWRKPAGIGYAGPAVADGKVYLMDYELKSGEVTASYAGRSEIGGREIIRCMDAATGEPVWTHGYDCPINLSYPNGPRCTPAISDGMVVTLGAEGMLCCLNAKTGKPVWTKDFKKDGGIRDDAGKPESPFWGYSGHPLINNGVVYCLPGGEGRVAAAYDLKTGNEIWKSIKGPQPGYAPPVLAKFGSSEQLLVWHPAALAGLDPKNGKELWSLKMASTYGMSIMEPRVVGDQVFVSCEGSKSLLARVIPGQPAEIVWENAKGAIHAKNATPIFHEGYFYGSDSDGDLQCMKLEDGSKVWETVEPQARKRKENSATIHLVRAGKTWVLFNDGGELLLADLSPGGYKELDRAKILEPTTPSFGSGSRKVVWAAPAFAQKCVFARNDNEVICVSLAAE